MWKTFDELHKKKCVKQAKWKRNSLQAQWSNLFSRTEMYIECNSVDWKCTRNNTICTFLYLSIHRSRIYTDRQTDASVCCIRTHTHAPMSCWLWWWIILNEPEKEEEEESETRYFIHIQSVCIEITTNTRVLNVANCQNFVCACLYPSQIERVSYLCSCVLGQVETFRDSLIVSFVQIEMSEEKVLFIVSLNCERKHTSTITKETQTNHLCTQYKIMEKFQWKVQCIQIWAIANKTEEWK